MSPGNTGVSVTPQPQAPGKQWYEEVWFIMVIIIAAILLLFLLFALCLRRAGPTQPFIRERMPLPPDQHKLPRDLYIIDAGDGSIIDAVSEATVSSADFQYEFACMCNACQKRKCGNWLTNFREIF